MGGCRVTKCRMCGCTWERGCPAGCAWANNSDLCTVCASFMSDLQQYIEDCARVSKASLGRMFDEVTTAGVE